MNLTVVIAVKESILSSSLLKWVLLAGEGEVWKALCHYPNCAAHCSQTAVLLAILQHLPGHLSPNQASKGHHRWRHAHQLHGTSNSYSRLSSILQYTSEVTRLYANNVTVTQLWYHVAHALILRNHADGLFMDYKHGGGQSLEACYITKISLG